MDQTLSHEQGTRCIMWYGCVVLYFLDFRVDKFQGKVLYVKELEHNIS